MNRRLLKVVKVWWALLACTLHQIHSAKIDGLSFPQIFWVFHGISAWPSFLDYLVPTYLNIVSASISANQTVKLGVKFSPFSSAIATSPPPLICKTIKNVAHYWVQMAPYRNLANFGSKSFHWSYYENENLVLKPSNSIFGTCRYEKEEYLEALRYEEKRASYTFNKYQESVIFHVTKFLIASLILFCLQVSK